MPSFNRGVRETHLGKASGEPVQTVRFVDVRGEKDLVLPVRLAVQAVLDQRDCAQVRRILTGDLSRRRSRSRP